MTARNLLPLFAEHAPGRVFDKAVVGGGLAATFAAYQYLLLAQQSGRPTRVLLIAQSFSAPCAAGNQIDKRWEGLLQEGAIRDPHIREIINGSIAAIEATIARERISCRLSKGYELKGATPALMQHAIDLMVDTGVEDRHDFSPNNDTQVLHLPEHPESAIVHGMGQLNVSEFLTGLRAAIIRMGGVIQPDCSFTGVSRDDQARYIVHTGHGDFISRARPLLATGAKHMAALPEIQPHVGSLRYTMGVVLGPLSPEDARKISNGPKSFSDTNIDERHDIVWGGLDPENNFTIGWGELDEGGAEDHAAIQEKIFKLVESYWPGLLARYAHTATISFAPMLRVKNELPVVGRLAYYDVSGGWGGFGIVPGFAAALALARADILGDERDLRFFESLQPGIFRPAAAPAPVNDDAAQEKPRHLMG